MPMIQIPRVDGTCMNFPPFSRFFSPIFLAQYFISVVIAPPPPNKKMALRCRQVCENEDDKDRCTLNRNLEGIKGTQFSISLEKTCY